MSKSIINLHPNIKVHFRAPVISVVHFQAEWADQCIHINQLLEALSSQSNYSNLKFYSCPAEELSEVSAKYNIEAVPTLILFRSGKSLEVIHGANTEKITEILQKYNGLSVGDQNIPLNERLKALINKGKVMLFMKGDRNVPRCGFSKQIIAILNDIR